VTVLKLPRAQGWQTQLNLREAKARHDGHASCVAGRGFPPGGSLHCRPTKSIGTGQFVIGTSKVRPRLNETFNQNEKLGLYVQLYNFGPDEKTQKPNGSIDYEVVKNSNNQKVFEFSEEVAKIDSASSNQTTVEKILPLKNLEPGQYTLKMKVTDRNRNQTLTPSASFTVN
jgi:hypothetical protein